MYRRPIICLVVGGVSARRQRALWTPSPVLIQRKVHLQRRPEQHVRLAGGAAVAAHQQRVHGIQPLRRGVSWGTRPGRRVAGDTLRTPRPGPSGRRACFAAARGPRTEQGGAWPGPGRPGRRQNREGKAAARAWKNSATSCSVAEKGSPRRRTTGNGRSGRGPGTTPYASAGSDDAPPTPRCRSAMAMEGVKALLNIARDGCNNRTSARGGGREGSISLVPLPKMSS